MLGRLYFFLSASILLFILHTIILIGLKNNPTAFDSLNTFFLDRFFGLLSFDSMGVSWLYISSFINIFCQLLIFIKLKHLTKSTTTSISRKTGWVALNTENSYSWWIIYLSIIHLSLTFLFLTDNIIIFYISFETTLLPFFLWIGEAAIRSRRWHAVFFLTFFTLIGSVGMLWSIAILYNLTNSFIISEYLYSIALTANIEFLSMLEKCTLCTLNGTSVEVSFEECESFWLNTAYTPTDSRKSLWVAFLLFTFSFLIKFPVFPVASWLCEAHVEASTEASVLLAAVLLKVAPYGFYKIILVAFGSWYLEYKSAMWIIGLFSALLYAIALLSQTDLKRSIAYTSIIHMSIMLCLMSSSSKTSIESAFLMGALHSFCSAGLFCCIGFLYDKDKNKNIHYLGGSVDVRPIFSTFFLLFNLVNIGYPLIGSYISECLLFVVSTASENHAYTATVATVLYLLTGSVFFMVSKVLYRSWSLKSDRKILDLSAEEQKALLLLFLICVILSVFPLIYLGYIQDSIHLYYARML